MRCLRGGYRLARVAHVRRENEFPVAAHERGESQLGGWNLPPVHLLHTVPDST
jgi:hypothetical protein